jgi:hypothetical protein
MSRPYSSSGHSSDLQHEEPRGDFRGIADETLALAGIAMPAIMDSKRSRSVALKITPTLALLLPTLPFAKAVQVLKSCSSK